jgi:hypothetical protein
MTGLTNYSADNALNYLTGQIAMPALPAVFLALFLAVGTDANTGFTEVSTSGTAYARVQVAGTVATNAATATSSPSLGFASVPSWIVAGMAVYDVTTGALVGTVASTASTTVTLTANAANAVASGNTLSFSAFGNGSGTAPSNVTNGAVISFAQATGTGFGTVIAWGLYDASTAGNLLWWDFLGNYPWLPFEMASGGNTATVKANGYASNDPIVFTAEYGGTLPTLSTGTMTGYTVNYVASPATDTIGVDTTAGPTTPVVTTSSGSGMVRKITQQVISANVTATFAASAFTLMLA